MNNLTKEELREKLASKENKLASKMINLIKSSDEAQPEPKEGQPIVLKNKPRKILSKGKTARLDNVLKLLEKGCPDTHFQRDPYHPRSRYRVEFVLDCCFETQIVTQAHDYMRNETIVGQNQENCQNCQNCHDFKNSKTHDNNEAYLLTEFDKESIEIFRILVKRGFRSGENSMRGQLTHHILNSVFYYANPKYPKEIKKQKYAYELSKILIGEQKIDINKYASNSYLWVGSIENLNKILSLGADPKGNALIDCAIAYVGCSPNSGENPEGRTKVIKELLKLGAWAKEPIEKRVGDMAIKKKLHEHGLLSQVEYQINSHKIKQIMSANS